jgi:DNA-binding Lrp family transcriptional regulator
LGIPEDQVLEILKRLCDAGVIRRFGATLRHQKSGFEANAMAAWQVAEDRIGEVGRTMASFPQVSHCYRRNPSSAWPYNLYTMVHAEDEAACRRLVKTMSRRSGVSVYAVLFSRRELKKTSMQYFPADNDD